MDASFVTDGLARIEAVFEPLVRHAEATASDDLKFTAGVMKQAFSEILNHIADSARQEVQQDAPVAEADVVQLVTGEEAAPVPPNEAPPAPEAPPAGETGAQPAEDAPVPQDPTEAA